MLKGYPLRDYTWKDWLALILSSAIVLQLVILFGSAYWTNFNATTYEEALEMLTSISNHAAIYGSLISLPLTLLAIYWLKIPIFNRRQIPKSEWFIVPGMTRKDWSFLTKYIPITFFLYVTGNVIMDNIFGEMEVVNQEAIESMFLDIPIWAMFLMVVIVAPITEEVLFRGLLLFKGSKLEPSWIRVIVSAILFGLVHTPTNIPSAYTYISMGLMFSYVSKHTKSIESAIVYHFLNNLFGFLSMLYFL